jgi:hypothetical protein
MIPNIDTLHISQNANYCKTDTALNFVLTATRASGGGGELNSAIFSCTVMSQERYRKRNTINKGDEY